MAVGSGAAGPLCFSPAPKIKQRQLLGSRQKDQHGLVVSEGLHYLPMDCSQEITLLSFVAWGIFCPHGAVQLQLFGGGCRLPGGAGPEKFNHSETLPFSRAVEKCFAAKARLNDGKCQGGIPGVKGVEDLISWVTSGVQTLLQV